MAEKIKYFVNGQYVESKTDKYYDLVNPSTGEVIGYAPNCTAEEVEEAIAAVLPYIGNAMVVKMGSKGSLLVKKDGSRNFMASFLNKEVVDAIGAGDSFNSGFISAFVAGHPLEDCQRNGNLTGAVNTTAAGGTGAFSSREAVAKVAEERFNVTLL
jgi:sugar/nucleoside kinase (ribokinase family)